MKKFCKKCGSFKVKKDGKMRGKQRYKCVKCGYVFQNASRLKINKEEIRKKYTKGKQTYKQLSEEYGVSIYTIRKCINGISIKKDNITIIPKTSIVIAIDATYFGSWGILVARQVSQNNELCKNVYWKIIYHEHKLDYQECVSNLQKQGYTISGIVCDGRKGVLGGFPTIPMQMCVFHQMKIMTRYLTRFPKLEANQELKSISLGLGKFSEKVMNEWLNDRYKRYEGFLNEKNDNNLWLHQKTIKAYRSLKTNWKYLFTYQKYKNTTRIPTTTNSLEGTFSHLKEQVNIHRGLSIEMKQKLVINYLSSGND